MKIEENRPVGRETLKSHIYRIHTGFYERYMHGQGIELGAQGYVDHKVIGVVPKAIPVNLDLPNYDGVNLPLNPNSIDFVFSSHVLEHIEDWQEVIQEWHRVVKVGGYIIIIVPHQYLYEKKRRLPSLYNTDHKRFYTPGDLLAEIESSLIPNSYRVMHLRDNDMCYDYSIPPEKHAVGCHEIELVIKKIKTPSWRIE